MGRGFNSRMKKKKYSYLLLMTTSVEFYELFRCVKSYKEFESYTILKYVKITTDWRCADI